MTSHSPNINGKYLISLSGVENAFSGWETLCLLMHGGGATCWEPFPKIKYRMVQPTAQHMKRSEHSSQLNFTAHRISVSFFLSSRLVNKTSDTGKARFFRELLHLMMNISRGTFLGLSNYLAFIWNAERCWFRGDMHCNMFASYVHDAKHMFNCFGIGFGKNKTETFH